MGKNRGPQAVTASLTRGLTQLGIAFELNPPINTFVHPVEIVHVISGIETLRWAIEQKKLGRIKKLVAGPTIVVSPLDHDAILASQEIDTILCPSQWVKDYYESKIPECRDKIRVWYAGVEIPEDYKKEASLGDGRDKKCLIYIKNDSYTNTDELIKSCTALGIKTNTINYGGFGRNQYFRDLLNSDFLIYVGKTESQGLALHEAWARNIPTLVLNVEKWKYKNDEWSDPLISAPYLDQTTGMFFKESDNLKDTLLEFIGNSRQFTPRDTSIRLFSDEETTKKYLKIISTHQLTSSLEVL
ncbi:MAG: hypothetical protein WCG97_01705 [bacterium]